MRRRPALAAIALSLLGVGATYARWEDLTEADWLYALATRMALVDGHQVHYPTPTAELAAALEARTETAALRHLAEARLELGDRAGAVAALEQWAEAEGASAWVEAARWGAAHGDWALAFRAAARALPGLPEAARRSLADDQVRWADLHPEASDPLAMRQARAEMFPGDSTAVEDWIRALEKAAKLAEADAALASAGGLSPERRLRLRSDLMADHGNHRGAFEVLDGALPGAGAWGPDLKQAYAQRTEKGNPGGPESWRAALDRSFDGAALVRLATYFEGQGRGDAAADLLRQVERRHEGGLDRPGWLLLARLNGEIDAVPEAFRDVLSAAPGATTEEQQGDLAALAQLALRAGGRPLAWGTYNDEPYRWVARLDRTPGFWTGGLSFLLTGQDWKDALERLEAESLPERTFATARALTAELARRAPGHPALPPLQVGIMRRHVERGSGREALALLPPLLTGAPEVVQEAQRVALLAMRQTDVLLGDELRVHRARLRLLAPDGSRPEVGRAEYGHPQEPGGAPRERYKDALDETVTRLEQRDRSHGTSVELLLGEMDRLPDVEELWLDLAARLSSWNLDDELGPRYERALERFAGPGWWPRLARWYARRSRYGDLERLAADLAARFRSAEIFAGVSGASGVVLEVPGQPPVGARVRLVAWADWVRLRALERFPHSPLVFREARDRLLARSAWEKKGASLDREKVQRVVVPDALLEDRRWAVLFADPEGREEYFAAAMRKGDLEGRLAALETGPARTPVEDQILFEGWSRLSRFEGAALPADRLAAAYPGDGELARRVLSLHRSLAALDPSQAAPAAALVARTAPALPDPNPLWTELGELAQESGRGEEAKRTWRHLLDRDPRDPDRIAELATILWDYGHMADALGVIEDARPRLSRPRLLAFEAGVLREEARDLPGAVREYLAALEPETGDCFCWFEREQRSLRRLSQLLARERVRRIVLDVVATLKPGVRPDEQALASLFPLAEITLPDGDQDFTVDDWIDEMDSPRDPVGRAQRAASRAAWRPEARAGIAQVGQALLDQTLAFVPRASNTGFLDAVERWSRPLLGAGAEESREVAFRSALMARRAELASTEEERITREAARARYLLENGRRQDADAVWSALSGRIGALPEGGPRMHAEADRAAYLERARGPEEAAAEWARLGARYPWSLGLLEDRLAFLARNGRGVEGRRILEGVIPRAAPGHREALLERLTREALLAQDLAQARRAVERLLAEPELTDQRRLGAVHLVARLSFREAPGFDAIVLARAQAASLKSEHEADLYAQLARAAGAERSWAASATLWVEALNRRLDRAWIREACASADKASKSADLLAFFEKQQARSPRDLRWAVAVREIRLQQGDLPGAIEMAKAATAIRPDRESLWREAAELLVRADRVREAADFLEGWQKARPADEGAMALRGELYARAGDGEKALALERAALEAFAREAPPGDDRISLVELRRGNAARRLRDYGLAPEAWRLLAGNSPFTARLAKGLAPDEEAQLALATGNFVRLLKLRAGDEDFRLAAAAVLRERGRPEQKEEAQFFVLDQLMPKAAGGLRGPGNTAALKRWWPFAQAAGLETPLRLDLARATLGNAAGPWQAEAPMAFVQSLAQTVVTEDASGPVFSPPPIEALWVRDLVRRDRAEALEAFLAPRWQSLLVEVGASTTLPPGVPRVSWASWLDDPEALATWARAAAAQPARVSEIAGILADRRRWDRFWALAARNWNVSPLVAVVPAEARTAWFRRWQVPSPQDADAAVRARGETVERVSLALGRLVAGEPGAAQDPLIVKLRGPRTVGDVLGKDPAWTWPEFAPRRGAGGEIAEKGDDRVVGQRADAGRVPGALWGEWPGAAWFALEALARLREGDPATPFVPLEAASRGREGERSSVAVGLAEALGNDALALELDEAHPSAAPAAVATRLRLLVKSVRKDEARATLEAEVRRQQPTLGEAGFRGLRRIATDLDLADPTDLLDPAAPLTPALLAYLYDVLEPAAASRFRPRDPLDFRVALASRWAPRPASLSAEQVRFYLSELWANEAAPLPERGLRRLGGLWLPAAAWLGQLPPRDRGAGLAAIAALPDTERLEALLARDPAPRSDTVRLLRLRVHLMRYEDGPALALLEETLAEATGERPLAFAPPPPAETEADETADLEPVVSGPAAVDADAVTARLEAWLAPFRKAKRVDLAAERVRTALRTRREQGPASASAWRLAFELTPSPPARAALGLELERAWARGDLPPLDLGLLVLALARVVPPEATRFLARWPPSYSYAAVERRALVLAALEDNAAAARVLVEGQRRGPWTAEEEVKAFDLWRSLAPDAPRSKAAAEAPAAWNAARVFWRKPAPEVGADLAEHLAAHPHDIRAARAALRTVAPGHQEALRRAGAVLQYAVWPGSGEAFLDQSFLRLRIARGLLPLSGPVAVRALTPFDATGLEPDLRRRRLPSADINAALADAARLAARGKQPPWLEPVMSALEDRRPEEGKALRAELRESGIPVGPPPTYRMAAGGPAPYRPRDLDFAVVWAAAAPEGAR